MREYGYRVRQRIRGGSRPTAALTDLTYSEPSPGQPAWLYVRLADTRSGRIIGSGAVALDSVAPTVRARSRAAVQSLAPCQGIEPRRDSLCCFSTHLPRVLI